MNLNSNVNEPKPQQMPLGAQIAQQESENELLDGDAGLLRSTSRRKRVSDGTLVLVGLLVVAGGVLGGMRLLSGRPGALLGADSEEKDTADRIKQIAGGADPAKVSARSTLDYDPVPLGEVKMNPFVLKVTTGEEDPGDPPVVEKQKADPLRDQLQAQFELLQLRSIMGREGKFVAMIDNNVVQVGDKVAKTFLITHIDANMVQMTAAGFDYTLWFRKPETEQSEDQ